MTLTERILQYILLLWWFMLQMTRHCDFSDKQRVSQKLDIRSIVFKKTPTATNPPLTIPFLKLIVDKIVFAFKNNATMSSILAASKVMCSVLDQNWTRC